MLMRMMWDLALKVQEIPCYASGQHKHQHLDDHVRGLSSREWQRNNRFAITFVAYANQVIFVFFCLLFWYAFYASRTYREPRPQIWFYPIQFPPYYSPFTRGSHSLGLSPLPQLQSFPGPFHVLFLGDQKTFKKKENEEIGEWSLAWKRKSKFVWYLDRRPWLTVTLFRLSYQG